MGHWPWLLAVRVTEHRGTGRYKVAAVLLLFIVRSSYFSPTPDPFIFHLDLCF